MVNIFFGKRVKAESVIKLYHIFIVSVLFLNISINGTIAKTIKVLDKETNTEVANATVKIYSNGKEIKIKTNKEGVFDFDDNQIKLPAKSVISCVGYYRFHDSIYSSTKEVYLMKKSIIIDEVVTTGQFIPQSAQESPFSVKVINQERIESQGAVNLKDVMTNELNVRISQDNVLGSSLNIRGISGQNIKILVDGVPVVGRVDGNIDISQLNLNNAERVEIIEGPLSTIYGTDALGGVINIISKSDYGKIGKLSINSFLETVGNYNFDANYSKQLSDFNIIASAGRNFFDGFDPINEHRRNLLWKPKEQYFGDISLGYNIENWNFKYSVKGFFETIQNKGEPRQPYYESAFDDYYYTNRLGNSLYIKGKVYGSKYLDMIFSYNSFERTKNTFFKDLVTLNKTISTVPGDNDTTNIGSLLARGTFSSDKSSKGISDDWANFSYQIGYDLNYEFVKGDRVQQSVASDKSSMGDYAGFLSIQYNPTKSFLLQPSVRYAYNTNYDAPIIPSLNLRYELGNSLIVRANYARGFRAPSLKELYLFFVDINHNIKGNPNLVAENSDTYAMNAEYSLQTENAVINFEPKVFYNDIRNQITLAFQEGTLYTYRNVGHFKSQGAEMSVNCITEDVTAKIGFSYIGRQSMLNDTVQSGEMLYSSELQANVMYDIKEIGAKLSVFYKYTGALPNLQLTADDKLQIFELQSFHTLDVTISKFFLEGMLNVTLGAKNLFNVTNLQSNVATTTGGAHSSSGTSFASGVGRTFFTSIKVNL